MGNPVDRLVSRLDRLETIAALAAQMRAAQARYFRGRERAWLIEAKGLEIRLDAALDALGGPTPAERKAAGLE
jgi:hypothetical protein